MSNLWPDLSCDARLWGHCPLVNILLQWIELGKLIDATFHKTSEFRPVQLPASGSCRDLQPDATVLQPSGLARGHINPLLVLSLRQPAHLHLHQQASFLADWKPIITQPIFFTFGKSGRSMGHLSVE